jgi:hypothetical protein
VFFTDWAQLPAQGNITVATMPYRDSVDDSSQQIIMFVFAAEIPRDSSKTVASVSSGGSRTGSAAASPPCTYRHGPSADH